MTNREFSEQDQDFKGACQKVGLLKQHPDMGLSRQAGKWKRKRGLAYKEGRTKP